MSKKVFVGNLVASVTEPTLKALFSQYGTVKHTKITKDLKGQSKGFGFIGMNTEKEAANAVYQLNGTMLEGQALVVNAAKLAAYRNKRARR
jgi:RNA recognition motif-containing protein